MYNEKVMEAFKNPKNVGEVENYDGIGVVGNASCGDIMQITFKVENGIITECKFTGGCRGNTAGLAIAVTGQNAVDVMNRLRGIPCRGATSCPDQLSRAIEQYLAAEAQ